MSEMLKEKKIELFWFFFILLYEVMRKLEEKV